VTDPSSQAKDEFLQEQLWKFSKDPFTKKLGLLDWEMTNQLRIRAQTETLSDQTSKA
jgi:hypothetical protein